MDDFKEGSSRVLGFYVFLLGLYQNIFKSLFGVYYYNFKKDALGF